MYFYYLERPFVAANLEKLPGGIFLWNIILEHM